MKISIKNFSIGLFAIALIGLLSFLIKSSLVYTNPDGITDEIISQKLIPVAESVDTASSEMRLTIPTIKVDAKVTPVGLTRLGNMAVPRNYTDVGWYRYGSSPGESGNAVLAGHVDNGLSLPGVFKRLDEAKVGDDIYIKMNDGKMLHFKVTKQDIYAWDAKVPEIFDKTGTPKLRLITCTGTWMPEHKTNDKRLVVTAELVP